jgi:hypothetical protein
VLLQVTSGSNLGRVAKLQFLQGLRKLVRLRELRLVNQYGHNRNSTRQGRLDLDTHEVLRVVEPALPARATVTSPLFPNERYEYVACRHSIGEGCAEIDPNGMLSTSMNTVPGPKASSRDSRTMLAT